MPNSTSKSGPTVHLIESDDAQPTLKIKPGMRFDVRVTTIVDNELKPGKKVAARLCGGTSTCLALVDLSS